MATGRTAHLIFKIPHDCGDSLSCNVGKQSSLVALIKESSLIIWDEASISQRENIEALDLFLRDLCLPNVPFGGKIIVLGDEFRFVRKKTQQQVIEYNLVCLPLWPLFTRLQLTENIRARDDQAFLEFFLALGNGDLQTEEIARIIVPFVLRLQCRASPACMDDLLKQIYPTISSICANQEMFAERAILAPRNEDVDLIKSLFTQKFCGDDCCYKSFDSVIDDDCKIYPTEFLNTLCPRGMSPHNLLLKLNCPIILLRTLIHQVDCFSKGELVLLPHITLRTLDSSGYPFHFKRMQFPIKLCSL